MCWENDKHCSPGAVRPAIPVKAYRSTVAVGAVRVKRHIIFGAQHQKDVAHLSPFASFILPLLEKASVNKVFQSLAGPVGI